MRVTQGMITNNMLSNLTNSYKNLDKYLNQLSTGRKINRPSDDPFITIKGHSYRTQVRQIEQYQRNLGEVHNWMDNTDDSLHNATNTLQRIRELANQAANDTYSDKERKNIQKEIEQLKEELIDIANTQVNGKYIFNGADTKNPPITKSMNENGEVEEIIIDFNDSEKDFSIKIGNGTKINANVFGGEIFGEDLLAPATEADGDIEASEGGVIAQLITALEEDDQEAISQSLGALDERIDAVINARADLGARMNRVDLIENRIEAQEITATDMMSKNENVDYEKAIMDLITQETLHRAAMSAGTRVIQPTLMDFLR